MITQGAQVTARCEDCGGVLIRDTGQYIDHGQLWWSTEGACESCPNRWCEQDTGGATPEEIRNALLAEHGPARLRIADNELHRLPVLRALREVLHLSLHQARATACTLRETGLVGTLVEMEFVAAGLHRRSVATSIETCGTQPD
ncbi:hypothetical protein OG204_15740 [Streptomyces sp. NBC_01387]|uniref:hypothetical protein n=1 Tax=unclassified Streptomyces TaxID=2593676 RepID=UPI002024C99A|nr:hypothetical protein [Streptomyces sp. A 4/2]